MFKQYPQLRAIAAYNLFYYGFLGVFSPYWGPYLRGLGVPMTMVGLMMSLPQINRIYAPALWGWCADYFGSRSLILRLANLGSLLGFTLLLFTRDPNWMFFSVLVASFFWSASTPQVEATTLTILKGDSGSYARMRAWGSIGFVLATLIGGYLIDAFGILSLPKLVVFIMLGSAVLSWRVPDSHSPRAKENDDGIMDILRRSEVRALLAGCLLIGSAHGLLSNFYSIHLDEHGIAKSTMGWMWSIGVLAEISIFWLMRHLTERFDRRSLYFFAMSSAVVRYLMIAWGTQFMSVLVIAQLMHAFTFAIHHAISISYFHRNFGQAHQTKGQALYVVFTFGIGGSLGGLIGGKLWNWLGGSWMFTLASLACFVALVICYLFIKDTKPSSESLAIARIPDPE